MPRTSKAASDEHQHQREKRPIQAEIDYQYHLEIYGKYMALQLYQ